MQNTIENLINFVFDDNVSADEYPSSHETRLKAREFREKYMLHKEIRKRKVDEINTIINSSRSSRYEKILLAARSANSYSISYRNFKMV